jgi:hypothetical protein
VYVVPPDAENSSQLAHIMSLDSPSVDLGAVAYGDTFMDAAGSTSCLSLTAGIQRMAGWMGAGQEEDTPHTRNLMHRLQVMMIMMMMMMQHHAYIQMYVYLRRL